MRAMEFAKNSDMLKAVRRVSALIEFARDSGFLDENPLWNEADLVEMRTGEAGRDHVRCQDGSGLYRIRLQADGGEGAFRADLVREGKDDDKWQRQACCPVRIVHCNEWQVTISNSRLAGQQQRCVALFFTTDDTVLTAEGQQYQQIKDIMDIFRHLDFSVKQQQ